MQRSPGRSSASPRGHGTRSRFPRPPDRRPRSSPTFRRLLRRSRQPPGGAGARPRRPQVVCACFSGDTLARIDDRKDSEHAEDDGQGGLDGRNSETLRGSCSERRGAPRPRQAGVRGWALDLRRADRPARRGLRGPAGGLRPGASGQHPRRRGLRDAAANCRGAERSIQGVLSCC
jgi:hypothetical protein